LGEIQEISLRPQNFFGSLALGDVGYCPYKEPGIFAARATCNKSEIFDRAIGHQQAMFGAEASPIDRGAIDDLLEMHPVVRMGSIEHHLQGGLYRRLAFKYSISLGGPVDFPARNVPAEAPGVAYSLRFGEVRLAAAQRLLGPLAFSSFSGFAQRAPHRGHEPR
jgi:hypothetical protein